MRHIKKFNENRFTISPDTPQNQRNFRELIYNGDFLAAKEMIKDGFNTNDHHNDGYRALIRVKSNDTIYQELVKIAIENTQNNKPVSIKWAAEWGRVDILKMWEETGIFNEMDEKQWRDLLLWSIISRASEAQDIAEVLKYLVSISNIAKDLIGPISEKWNYGKYLEIFNHFNK